MTFYCWDTTGTYDDCVVTIDRAIDDFDEVTHSLVRLEACREMTGCDIWDLPRQWCDDFFEQLEFERTPC